MKIKNWFCCEDMRDSQKENVLIEWSDSRPYEVRGGKYNIRDIPEIQEGFYLGCEDGLMSLRKLTGCPWCLKPFPTRTEIENL